MHQSPPLCFCLEDLQICISCPLEILQLIMLPALLGAARKFKAEFALSSSNFTGTVT